MESWIRTIDRLGAKEFQGFFFNHKLEEIYLENVKELFSCTLFNTTTPRLREEQQQMMFKWIDKLEVTLKCKFKPGYNLNVRCMRPTLDAVKTIHRPLLF